MQNIKPISNTEILIARIKGVFPFFIHLSVAQIILATLWLLDCVSVFIAIIPYFIIALYYIGYGLFIQASKLIIKYIHKTNKR